MYKKIKKNGKKKDKSAAASGSIGITATQTFQSRSDREINGNEYMDEDKDRNGSREGSGS